MYGAFDITVIILFGKIVAIYGTVRAGGIYPADSQVAPLAVHQ